MEGIVRLDDDGSMMVRRSGRKRGRSGQVGNEGGGGGWNFGRACTMYNAQLHIMYLQCPVDILYAPTVSQNRI